MVKYVSQQTESFNEIKYLEEVKIFITETYSERCQTSKMTRF